MNSVAASNGENIALVQNTVHERDPHGECVIIGSAAIAAHFYEADAACPIVCSDDDALCSREFFDAQL